MPAPGLLFEDEFRAARSATPVYCHTDFLEKLNVHKNQPVGKRASLLLQRLLVDARRLHYKGTHGADNRGWRRSRLGGSSGSHFYAWWAPAGALPLRGGLGFDDAPEGSLFVRDLRHHDDHSPLPAHSFGDYLPITVSELRHEDYGPAPWTPQQVKFAGSRDMVRLLKGHPGSGKTSALLHAADVTQAQRVLYLTFSPDLAGIARDYFDRYCSAHRTFQVLTFPNFIRQLVHDSSPQVPLAELRQKFRGDLYSFSRSLGAWMDSVPALYDEFHAHLVGSAMPVNAGRFSKSSHARREDADYREQRGRSLGPAANQAADAALRLERNGGPLAPRYFPELSLAWNAATALVNRSDFDRSFLEFDCIAVDECQDLTPIETFVVAILAQRCREHHRRAVPVLLAGDEAQTVRPTDFEWGWLSDIFHHVVGTPSEHRLTSNLRSPRRIAEVVNRAWDLYHTLVKQDRPGGTGWAVIEDESTDQILYCAAAPGRPLDDLLTGLAQREGLAMVAFGDPLPAIPAAVRQNILSPTEVKGLDFHSVCVIDGGRLLVRVDDTDTWRETAAVDALAKRLAIDQVRVAVSRPTERLIWLDINPDPDTVQTSVTFLSGATHAHASTVPVMDPEALGRALAEEDLDIEERIQRCLADARQYLSVRPEMAWSRAHQAVMLLGTQGELGAVQDPLTRSTAYLTLAEICFTLGIRRVALPWRIGEPELWLQALKAVEKAGRAALAIVIGHVSTAVRSNHEADPVARAINAVVTHRDKLEPWLTLGLAPYVERWVEALESDLHVGDHAARALDLLPPFFQAMSLPDAAERATRLRKRALDVLMKGKQYAAALEVLRRLPQRQYKQEGVCLEAMDSYAEAAKAFLQAGALESALDCYRQVPDFQSALELVRRLHSNHPASASLEWVAKVKALATERPADFNKVMKPAEKQLLVEILESALGVQKKKPAVKKAGVTKAAVKKAAPKKVPRRSYLSGPF